MEAANSLQMTRSEFLALDEEDRAWQIAYIGTKSRMQAVEHQEYEKAVKRQG